MTLVDIYARYSSENQRDASIEDQVRICRERAEREGWTVRNLHTDHAISGASMLRRPGIQMLMQDAMSGKVQIVLAEALDRLSRDQEDIAGIYKRLRFAGVKIFTLSEGEITDLHIGLKGTMNALFLKDLSEKVKRGQRGRIEHGKSGGGNCYGYDVVRRFDDRGELVRGDRTINVEQAVIVRRIFEEYRRGKSPKAIAAKLNAERVPGPTKAGWSPSTINGNWQRGTGIINNELYVGELVWNRVSYPKSPLTGRKVSRLNPEAQWIRASVPEMRIVEQEVWDDVRERQVRSRLQSTEFWQHQRPKYLFSYLLKCGCCGGGMCKMSTAHYGCSTARNKGEAMCANRRTIRQDDLEHTVLTVLQQRLMRADLVEQFCTEYTSHLNRLRIERNAAIHAYHAELDRLDRRESQMVRAIMDGFASPKLKGEMDELLARQAELKYLLETTEAAPVLLHPNMAQRYRDEVVSLVRSLNDPHRRHEGAELIRSLVDRIVLTPDTDSDGLLIDVYGDLAGILNVAIDRKADQELDFKQIRLVVGLPEARKSTVPPKVAAAARHRALQASNMMQGKVVAVERTTLATRDFNKAHGKVVVRAVGAEPVSAYDFPTDTENTGIASCKALSRASRR